MTNLPTIRRYSGGIIIISQNSDSLPFIVDNSGQVGIGTSPTSLLSVGPSSQFQVNSSGNIIKINNVTYSFPTTQGPASTTLINDGTGNLSWSTAGTVLGNPVAGGTAGSILFINSSGNLAQNNSQFYWDSINNRLGVGTASPQASFHTRGTSSYGQWRLAPTSSGGETSLGFFDDTTGTATSTAWIIGQNVWSNTGDFGIGNENGGAGGNVRFLIERSGNVGIGTTNPSALFSVGSTSQFQVNSAGNIIRINNVAYSFPSLQGSANAALVNDGSGNLTWSTTGAGINYPVSGGTSGSILFVNSSGNLAQNNSQFFWDNSNFRLGIGTASPSQALDVSGNVAVSGNIVISGDLTVNGTTTTVNTTNLEVKDNNIRINRSGTDASASGAGLSVEGTSNSTLANLLYDGTLASRFKIGANGSESEIITASTTQLLSGQKTFTNAVNQQYPYSKKQPFLTKSKSGLYKRSEGVLAVTNLISRTSSAESNPWFSVCWSPELGLFAAVANSGTNRVMTSPDGITWTGRTSSSESNSWIAICWSAELGLFAAVANSGTNRVMTSPDGITWTGRASSNDSNSWNHICWSPELGLFVALASSGSNRVMTSPDGITWTGRTSSGENNQWSSACWSAELGIFVAVASSNSTLVMTSPDGITWTGRTSSNESSSWSSVCWSAELGLFVAVAQGGTNRVMTSPDGITWTNRTASSLIQWISVCWSAELGLFAAVSNSGTNRVMTSPDGITWTGRTSSNDSNSWRSICWSPELGIFTSVATFGTNRVMTTPSLGQITAGNQTIAGAKTLTGNTTINANSSTDALKITQAGTGNVLLVEDEASDTTPFVIKADGKVGIGTSLPSYLTHIASATEANHLHSYNSDATSYLHWRGQVAGTAGSRIVFTGPSFSDSAYGQSTMAIQNETTTGDIRLMTSGTNAGTRLIVKSDGKVGIGTSSPTATLDVSSTDPYTFKVTYSGGDGDARMLFSNTGNTAHMHFLSGNSVGSHGGGNPGNALIDFRQAKDLVIGASTDNNLAGRLNFVTIRGDNGYTGIGTVNPLEVLHVNGNGRFDGTGAVKITSGTTAQRPGSALNGMIRYNSESNSFEGYVSNSWSDIGGGGSIIRVTQSAHGFVAADVGRPVYLNNTTYALAKADVETTAEVAGLIYKIIDANTFQLCLGGEVSPIGANALDATTPIPVYSYPYTQGAAGTIISPTDVYDGSSFTSTTSGTLSSIQLPCQVVGQALTGTAVVRIYELTAQTSAGLPTGSPIASSQTIDLSTLAVVADSTMTTVTVNFTTTASLVAGRYYGLIVFRNATSGYLGAGGNGQLRLSWTNTVAGGAVSLSTSITPLAAYLANYRDEFKNPNFYNYSLDGDAFYINDGGGDMYDSGNFTYPWLLSGIQQTSSGSSALSNVLSYSTTTAATIDTDFKYASLGYVQGTSGLTPATSHPLMMIGTRTTAGSPVGFQKSGNSGADGSGTLVAEFIYQNATINGFTVYAYVRQTYGAGDPSHCDVYILLGHPNWNSVFGTVTGFGDPTTNGGNGGYLYTSGAGTQNILAVTLLLSKASGVQVTNAECQASVTAIVNRIKEYVDSTGFAKRISSADGASWSGTFTGYGLHATVSLIPQPSLVPGEAYFLSAVAAGKITTLPPSIVGQISKPIGIARTTSAIDFFNMRGSAVGGSNVYTQISLAGSTSESKITTIQNVSSYDSIELTGWVQITATTPYRFLFKAQVTKNGANTDYLLSYQTSGNTPPVGFDITVTTTGLVQLTLPALAGFTSAIAQFSLNGPAVGASLPLQIDSSNVSFSLVQAKDASGITFKRSNGSSAGTLNDSGYWLRPSQPIISGQMGTALIDPIVGPQKLAFNEFWVNRGITYDSVNRRFYVPIAGVYRITLNPFFKTGVSARRVLVGINNDTPTTSTHYGHTYSENAEYETGCINSIVSLNANDYVVFYLQSGALYNLASDKFNQFSIELIG